MLERMSERGYHSAQAIMVPWAYWWHRYVLGHQMAGPQEAGQVDIWHDEVCGRPFHMLARLPDEAPL
jgi:hypothetical protein